MIKSRTYPRWIHTYAFNFWAIPALASFQKIQSQCSAVDLSSVLWSNWERMGQRSAHVRKSGVSADARSQFIFGGSLKNENFPPAIVSFAYQDASFHENARPHEYVSLLRQRSTHLLQRMRSFSKSWCWNLPYESTTWGYHLTIPNVTMSVNQDREEKKSKHIPIASVTPY